MKKIRLCAFDEQTFLSKTREVREAFRIDPGAAVHKRLGRELIKDQHNNGRHCRIGSTYVSCTVSRIVFVLIGTPKRHDQRQEYCWYSEYGEERLDAVSQLN